MSPGSGLAPALRGLGQPASPALENSVNVEVCLRSVITVFHV